MRGWILGKQYRWDEYEHRRFREAAQEREH